MPQQMETAYQCQFLIFPKDDLIQMVLVFEIKNESILTKNAMSFTKWNCGLSIIMSYHLNSFCLCSTIKPHPKTYVSIMYMCCRKKT